MSIKNKRNLNNKSTIASKLQIGPMVVTIIGKNEGGTNQEILLKIFIKNALITNLHNQWVQLLNLLPPSP